MIIIKNNNVKYKRKNNFLFLFLHVMMCHAKTFPWLSQPEMPKLFQLYDILRNSVRLDEVYGVSCRLIGGVCLY